MKNISNKQLKHMYIILVDKNKDIFKIGRTKDMRERLKSYATGKITHPDIKFILLVDDPLLIENCAKLFLKKYQHRDGKELYKVSVDTIKKVMFSCAMIGRNADGASRHATATDDEVDAYIVYDDARANMKAIEYVDHDDNVVGYESVDPRPSNKKKAKPKSKKKIASKAKGKPKSMDGGAEKRALSGHRMFGVYQHIKHMYTTMTHA